MILAHRRYGNEEINSCDSVIVSAAVEVVVQ